MAPALAQPQLTGCPACCICTRQRENWSGITEQTLATGRPSISRSSVCCAIPRHGAEIFRVYWNHEPWKAQESLWVNGFLTSIVLLVSYKRRLGLVQG
ncbi:hypothetical protein PoB_005972200 [Plakobranchus ocellatus]|uniref:Uncharacterized protein n=1 Tax=Plakobranchus ocellatus TaxID=259542 RepID=A0AAV4CMY8_9GAST|nr:hypothetical protein PoB_005972200 [Plakobranchus ocellatus]